MSTKKNSLDARARELRARQRAATRAVRHQQALQATATAGLRRIVRLPELEVMVGRGRSAIHEDIIAGRFPKPIPLGGRAVGWLIEEIELWLADRINDRKVQAAIAKRNQHIEAAE